MGFIDEFKIAQNGAADPVVGRLAVGARSAADWLGSFSNLALLLLDAHPYIVSANRRAEALLRSGDCLVSEDGMLSASNGYRSALAKCIHRVINYPHHEYATMLMVVPSKRLPVSVMVRQYTAAGAAAIVIVSDPNMPVLPVADVLQALYGLTDAESRVAYGIAAGLDLSEISRVQKISVHTVRSHLKRLFQKTGARRQSELILILLTSPAVAE